MAAYIPTGSVLTIGSTDSFTIDRENVVNPITGGNGVSFIKIDNVGNAITTSDVTSTSTTYSFSNVSGTTTGFGSGATFDIVASFGNVYTVTLNQAGLDYTGLSTITIAGTDVGGASPANNISINVGDVGDNGEIQNFVATGTALWPQTVELTALTAPQSTDFVQVSSGGSVYVNTTVTNGNVYITPVQILD